MLASSIDSTRRGALVIDATDPDVCVVVEVGDRLLEQDLELCALERAIGLRVARLPGRALTVFVI